MSGMRRPKKRHELLDLLCQQGVHLVVVHLINEFHLRGQRMANGHYIDTVWGTRRDLDKLTADPAARASKLMTFDGGHDKALDSPHPHTERKELHDKCFAGARRP